MQIVFERKIGKTGRISIPKHHRKRLEGKTVRVTIEVIENGEEK